jgi:choline dehydrogenase
VGGHGQPGLVVRGPVAVFRAVESDADFGGDWHRADGAVPIRRPSAGELSPLQRVFADAAVAAGHRLAGDHSEPGTVGTGPGPRNVRDGLRMSTALTHLAAARGRSNLAIRAGAAVDRVELHGTTARGIRLADGQVIEADAIVVTAGSYASPAILMQSGIGPAAALRDLGIGVAADLPGGGDNLIDHPLAAVDLPTAPGFAGPRFQVMLTLRSPWPTQAGHPTCTFSPPDRSTTPRARQAGYSASAPGCWRSAPGARRACARLTLPIRRASTSPTCATPRT